MHRTPIGQNSLVSANEELDHTEDAFFRSIQILYFYPLTISPSKQRVSQFIVVIIIMSTQKKFSSEDIASGTPGYVSPLSVDFSPDGKTYAMICSLSLIHQFRQLLQASS